MNPRSMTAVEVVTRALRERILAGELAPGSPLREQALSDEYTVARHTLRAALRALAAERLAVVEAHRGVRVAALDAGGLVALFELRAALEVEAARLLAERTGPAGLAELPDAVLAAARTLDAACAANPVDRAAVDAAHAALHHALVVSAGSARLTEVHAALDAESRLALVQSRTAIPVTLMAAQHRALLADLATVGPDALRQHLRAGRKAAQPDEAAQPEQPPDPDQPTQPSNR